MDADRIRNLRPDLIDTIDLLAGKAIRESSDADRIRQALRNTIGLTLDDPEADEDQEVLRAAALAHADCLDGPTETTRERVAKAIGMADVPNPGDSQQDHYLRLADATLRVLLLSGPTDEDVEVVKKFVAVEERRYRAGWNALGIDDYARQLLEAVWQARRNKCS